MSYAWQILIGHLIGDYLLQNNWMAQRKGASYLACVVHCLIYTMCLCTFVTGGLNPWWAALVFISHFPIDKWSLADKWLKLINSRSLERFLQRGHKKIPKGYNHINYISLRAAFTGVVYVVTDNTFHLILMLYGYKLLKAFGLM